MTAGRRREAAGKVQDVVDGRGAERIDRLGVVADDAQSFAVGFQRKQNVGLQRIGVLVLVDQHMVEALRRCPERGRVPASGCASRATGRRSRGAVEPAWRST